LDNFSDIKPLGFDLEPSKLGKEIFTMGSWLLTLVTSIISPIISAIAPELKQELSSFLQTLYTKAKATASPLDDIGIKFLADILGITVS
jgi:hypothetical protein